MCTTKTLRSAHTVDLYVLYGSQKKQRLFHYTTFTRTLPDNVQQLHVRQPSTYAKPEAACAVLGS